MTVLRRLIRQHATADRNRDRPTKAFITLVTADRGWGVGVIPAGTVVGLREALPPPGATAPYYARAVPLKREPRSILRLITEHPTRPGDLVRCRIDFARSAIDP